MRSRLFYLGPATPTTLREWILRPAQRTLAGTPRCWRVFYETPSEGLLRRSRDELIEGKLREPSSGRTWAGTGLLGLYVWARPTMNNQHPSNKGQRTTTASAPPIRASTPPISLWGLVGVSYVLGGKVFIGGVLGVWGARQVRGEGPGFKPRFREVQAAGT